MGLYSVQDGKYRKLPRAVLVAMGGGAWGGLPWATSVLVARTRQLGGRDGEFGHWPAQPDKAVSEHIRLGV